MSDELLLNEAAHAVWQTVKDHGPIELGKVAIINGVDQAQVAAVATQAIAQGYFGVDEHEREELAVSEDARDVLNKLPEKFAVAHIIPDEQIGLPTFIEWANSENI